ncbi:D-glucuronyl C5-epimerase family protein [Glycomyces tenuis]|uniref:D-glucuronyl C5-epimerase family protein n=1 Tax=Glycomyces tenuis TaxID=58116 RepID=UPI00040B682F|nr:D-glucuronyl C5-epimerase family protein [Glycomyces tenuis]
MRQTQYAISLLGEYEATGDAAKLAAAEANARDLLDTAATGWVLEYGFDFALHGDKKNTVHAPWRSAMEQGQFLSLATRLWRATDDRYWRDAAEHVFRTLLDEDSDRWTTFVDDDGYTWLEEYAGDVEPMRVLNGHVFAMYGLYDYWQATKDEAALLLFNKAAATVLHYVPRLRVPGGPSWYGMRVQDDPKAQSEKYHRIHIRQLEHLAAMTGADRFKELAELLREDFA